MNPKLIINLFKLRTNQGAIASDSVRTLLTKKGIYKKYTDAKIAAKKAAKSEAK